MTLRIPRLLWQPCDASSPRPPLALKEPQLTGACRQTRTSGGCPVCDGRHARCCPRSVVPSPAAPLPCVPPSPRTSLPPPPPTTPTPPRYRPQAAGCEPSRPACCCCAALPPLTAMRHPHPLQAWSGAWQVVRGGDCDTDGWQYAAAWPKGSAQWAAAPSLSHVVRRRRWRRPREWSGSA
jgi:hypothetical protein